MFKQNYSQNIRFQFPSNRAPREGLWKAGTIRREQSRRRYSTNVTDAYHRSLEEQPGPGMQCCSRNRTELVNQISESLTEKEIDDKSKASTTRTESGKEEDEDPDSLSTFQVSPNRSYCLNSLIYLELCFSFSNCVFLARNIIYYFNPKHTILCFGI